MGLPQAVMENEELITDLARYVEGVLTEQQIRKKYHLADEAAWTALNDDWIARRREHDRDNRCRLLGCEHRASPRLGDAGVAVVTARQQAGDDRNLIDLAGVPGQRASGEDGEHHRAPNHQANHHELLAK